MQSQAQEQSQVWKQGAERQHGPGLFGLQVLFGKSASYKRAAAKYRGLCNDDVFLRLGEFRGSKAEDRSEHLPRYFRKESNKMQR